MELNIKKIKDQKNSKFFWIVNGFSNILDGLVKILSLGIYSGNFAINHLIKYRNKNK